MWFISQHFNVIYLNLNIALNPTENLIEQKAKETARKHKCNFFFISLAACQVQATRTMRESSQAEAVLLVTYECCQTDCILMGMVRQGFQDSEGSQACVTSCSAKILSSPPS